MGRIPYLLCLILTFSTPFAANRLWTTVEGKTQLGELFEIEGDDSGLIIGRKGETLRSFEFLISFIIKRQLDKRVRVILDVEGYQERRRSNLVSVAETAAKKVVRYGKPIKMDPMSPFDRRIVHLALEKDKKIITESQGTGPRRQVVIKLK